MNIPQVVAHEDGSGMCMKQYQWNTFISSFCKTLPDIQKYHHFRFTKDDPKCVFVKEHVNAVEKRIAILKKKATVPRFLPPFEAPPGLSVKRKHYLYKYIRPYVRPEHQDLVPSQKSLYRKMC
ncbi:uncharacterized protein LOC117101762 [Anneissia japonica]|uniref:uncharacterized protein LOC117101762 n=1 Tax=Anneissia japonica TaxID=1529436 RepID=UPI001425B2FA|nr:uncharacterized protein LOC117101762 [Anneissia japonica]